MSSALRGRDGRHLERRNTALRSKQAEPGAGRCAAFACPRPVQRAIGSGLSPLYCKRHVEHIRRHGHSHMKTPKKAALEPYRKAARSWVARHRGERAVARVLAALDGMLQGSGRPINAYRLRGETPEARARNVLARNREAGKTGEDLLIIVLALRAYIAEHGPRGAPDYRHTQIAKLMHRVSSGSNRTLSGFPMPQKNPRPEGRFMVHLGARVDDIACIAADDYAVEEVLAEVAGANALTRDRV